MLRRAFLATIFFSIATQARSQESQLKTKQVISDQQGSHNETTHDWTLETFEEKLILADSIYQVSLAVGKSGPMIAYADNQQIRLLNRNDAGWNSAAVDNTNNNGASQVKILVTEEGLPHLVYIEQKDLFSKPIYTSRINGKWVKSQFDEEVMGSINDLRIHNAKCRVVVASSGTVTQVYDCDPTSVTKVLRDGSHFYDVKLTSQGEIFGVSRWLPLKGESMKRFHCTNLITKKSNEVIKMITSPEEVKYQAKIATSPDGFLTTIYSSNEEFYHATRKSDTNATGLIEGNWNIYPYKHSEFDLGTTIQDYAVGSDQTSYMLYTSAKGQVVLAIFPKDSGCIIEKIADGKAISLAIDQESNPHVLYNRPDGAIHYVHRKPKNSTLPVATTVKHQRANLLIKNLPLTGHVNHAKNIPTTPAGEAIEPTYPTAEKIPGKEGYVFSPYNRRILDVRGISSGTLVQDTTFPSSEKKFFKVP